MLLLSIVVKVITEINICMTTNHKMEKHKIEDRMMAFFVEKDLIKEFKEIFSEEARVDDKFERNLYVLSGENPFDEETMKKKIAEVAESKNDLISPKVKDKIFQRFKAHMAEVKQVPITTSSPSSCSVPNSPS